MVVANNLSFSICDVPEMKDMIKYARPGLQKVISRSSITQHVKELFHAEIADLKLEFSNIHARFALTLNEWNPTNGYRYVGITLHFFNDFFELKNYTIGFAVVNDDVGSAEALRNSLSEVLVDYDIQDRIISITAKNAGATHSLVGSSDIHYKHDSNIQCAGAAFTQSCEAILQYTFFREEQSGECVASVQEIDEKMQTLPDLPSSIKSLPRTIRNIVKEVHGGSTIEYVFARLVETRTLRENTTADPATLQMDNQTDWVSTYNLIDRFVYFRDEINGLLEQVRSYEKQERDALNLDVFEITDLQWDYLLTLRKILVVYYEATVELQASTKASIHLTIPYVSYILKDLKTLNSDMLQSTNPYLARGLSEAYGKLHDYYPIHSNDGQRNLHLYLATVLDPRLKLAFFKQKGFSAEVIEQVKGHFYDVYYRYKREYEEKKTSKNSNRKPPTNSFTAHVFDEEVSSNGSFFLDDEESSDDDFNEVTTYLSEKRVGRDRDVVEFYQIRRNTFPVIYQIAKDVLAIPSMTGSAESLFPQVKDIIAQNRRSPELARMLAFLRYRGRFSVPEETPESSDDDRQGNSDRSGDEEEVNGNMDEEVDEEMDEEESDEDMQ
ncbi:hypothetical protein JCM33374_g2858 [Metschnikowia sp. JCM 33374]|nr:hypothetical protein JCM33374_g2858 [Metschnikowia sp. JCM 33374]